MLPLRASDNLHGTGYGWANGVGGGHAMLTSAVYATMMLAQGNLSAGNHWLAQSHFMLIVNQKLTTAINENPLMKLLHLRYLKECL